MNFVKGMQSFQSPGGAAFPGILSADNYPTSSPSNNIFGTVSMPVSYGTGQLVIKWTGTADIQLTRGSPGFTVISDPGSVVNGGTGFNLRVTGTNGRVVFTFATSMPASVDLDFLAGGTFSGFSGLIICRIADESAVTSNPNAWNADLITEIQMLNPRSIRTLTWHDVNDENNLSRWKYRTPTTALTYFSQRWDPGAWAGDTSGTNTYTCSSATDSPGAYTDKEVIQVRFVLANTTTTPSLNRAGLGAKTITDMGGNALTIGAIAANSLATLVRDATLDVWLWSAQGITAWMPPEILADFANTVGCDLWTNIPHLAEDDYVTQQATSYKANLNSTRVLYEELSNEVWNFSAGFEQTQYANAVGTALGFQNNNNRRVFSWYAKRVAEVMALITTAWSGRSMGTLKRVLAVQAFGETSATQTYRINGGDLATWGFNSSPNRPRDRIDVLAYAHYVSGAQMRNFDSNYSGSDTFADLLTQADLYATGTTLQKAAALAWLDNDFRNGADSSGGTSYQTMGYLNTNIYPAWETVVTSESPAKIVECYEGACEMAPPSAGILTAMGKSNASQSATRCATLLTDYKNSAAFKQAMLDLYGQVVAQPHTITPAQLLIEGGSQWALRTGDLYSSTYKNYDAIVAFDTAIKGGSRSWMGRF